jgi:DNA-binding LacI/PurR family transcriptional regulator
VAVTQQDVARRAGVSQRTVSNVVNGLATVGEDARERVIEAIRELGYRPSLAARGLRSGRSGVLQLVVPELDVPYFAELARRVVSVAEDRGYAVLVRQTLGDRDRERDALAGAAADYAEGTILSAVNPVADLLTGRESGSPVVLIGESTGLGLVDHIGIDDAAAAFAATDHLIRSGRRRVAFIGTHPDASLRMATLRLGGYRDALLEAGLPLDPRLIVQIGSYHREDGARAMSSLLELEDPPDAVFAATDLLALGALHRAHERGVRVPQDVAVVGFDGLEEGRYSVPTLTTIAPDKGEVARLSVETLLDRIRARESSDPSAPVTDLPVPFDLVVRASAPAPR